MTIKLTLILVGFLIVLSIWGLGLYYKGKEEKENLRRYRTLYGNIKALSEKMDLLSNTLIENRKISTQQHTEIYSKIPDVVNGS